MLQFNGARMFVAEHLASLRIDPRHHVPNDPILAGAVHGLKNQQNGIAAGGV